ncbi:MAG: glycosyltransferase, partial [Candidatus Sericytochromatia bacterium]
SKYGLNRILKVALDLITVKFLSTYATKPIYVFGGAGFLSMFLAVLSGSYAVYLKLSGYADFIQTPLPLLTVTLLILGVQLILMGLLAELLVRTYHESQGKRIYQVKETMNLDH